MLHLASGDGRHAQLLARAVIDASGTWRTPNPLGADGLPALGEAAAPCCSADDAAPCCATPATDLLQIG